MFFKKKTTPDTPVKFHTEEEYRTALAIIEELSTRGMSASMLLSKVQERAGRIIEIPSDSNMEEASSSHTNVLLGVEEEGDAYWDVTYSPHLLCGGVVGSGASILTRNLIIHGAHHADTWDMYGIDLRHVELSAYEPHMKEIASTEERALELVQGIHTEMFKRYTDMETEGVNNIDDLPNKPPRIMLIVDELNHLLKPTEEEIMDLLIDLARLGHAAGVHLAIFTRTENIEIPEELNANFSFRYAVGHLNERFAQTILNESSLHRVVSPIGHAIMSVYGKTHPVQIKYAPEDFLDRYALV